MVSVSKPMPVRFIGHWKLQNMRSVDIKFPPPAPIETERGLRAVNVPWFSRRDLFCCPAFCLFPFSFS